MAEGDHSDHTPDEHENEHGIEGFFVIGSWEDMEKILRRIMSSKTPEERAEEMAELIEAALRAASWAHHDGFEHLRRVYYTLVHMKEAHGDETVYDVVNEKYDLLRVMEALMANTEAALKILTAFPFLEDDSDGRHAVFHHNTETLTQIQRDHRMLTCEHPDVIPASRHVDATIPYGATASCATCSTELTWAPEGNEGGGKWVPLRYSDASA